MEKEGIYTDKAVGVATYLGGPLVGGYLLSRNFKILGEEDKARNAIFLGLILFFIIFELLFLVPDSIINKIPNTIIPGIYTLIFYFLFKKYQDEKVKTYLKEGGGKASGWKIFGISIIGLILTLAYIFARAYFIAPFDGEVMEFGTAKHQIYYQEDISQTEVHKLGESLIEFGYFQAKQQQVINLEFENNKYRLFIYVNKKWWSDKDIVESLYSLEDNLSKNVLLSPVNIIMIEDGLKGREEMQLTTAIEKLNSP